MKRRELQQQVRQLEGYLNTSNRLLEKIEDERDEARQLVETLSNTCDNIRHELAVYIMSYSEVAGRLSAHLGIPSDQAVTFGNEILEATSAKIDNQPF